MNKMRIIAAVTAVLLAAGASAVFAQDRLPASSKRPVVNGVVTEGEYTWSHDFDQQITLYASRTKDTLYLGVVANTSGWVGVGLGSPKMDGAAIYMGFVGADGKESFKPQIGSGHRHHDAPADINGAVLRHAVKQSGGKTTLEIELKAAAFIKSGQSSLDLIFAMGDQRSFTPYHSYRNSTSLALD